MNLAEYAKMDKQGPKTDNGEFLGFEHGQTRTLRFLYESGGESLGSDIKLVWKKWNKDTKKFEYEEGQGSQRAILNCIEYDAEGGNPRLARLDVSAYMTQATFLPAWKNYGKIIDGVWKVTCLNPKTTDLTYSLFPVINADIVKYPIIKAEEAKETTKPKTESAKEEPKAKKKYWE